MEESKTYELIILLANQYIDPIQTNYEENDQTNSCKKSKTI